MGPSGSKYGHQWFTLVPWKDFCSVSFRYIFPRRNILHSKLVEG